MAVAPAEAEVEAQGSSEAQRKEPPGGLRRADALAVAGGGWNRRARGAGTSLRSVGGGKGQRRGHPSGELAERPLQQVRPVVHARAVTSAGVARAGEVRHLLRGRSSAATPGVGVSRAPDHRRSTTPSSRAPEPERPGWPPPPTGSDPAPRWKSGGASGGSPWPGTAGTRSLPGKGFAGSAGPPARARGRSPSHRRSDAGSTPSP